jgi:hypothetical protein
MKNKRNCCKDRLKRDPSKDKQEDAARDFQHVHRLTEH